MRQYLIELMLVGAMVAPVHAQSESFPIEAGSWGGNVRAGPSTGSADIGSLRNGAPITLLERTSEMFNGYPWFRIRTQDGQEGYQWGGIICGYDAAIKGAFATCEADLRDGGTTESAAGAISSTYTPLDTDACDVVEFIEEGGSVTLRCPGYEDIDLMVLEGDGRMDVDARAEDSEFISLSPFNVVGEVVEWRLSDGAPFAIIYRLRTATPEVPESSRLFIKTVPEPGTTGCLVGEVDGAVPNANQRAREIADTLARGVRCGADSPEVVRAGD